MSWKTNLCYSNGYSIGIKNCLCKKPPNFWLNFVPNFTFVWRSVLKTFIDTLSIIIAWNVFEDKKYFCLKTSRHLQYKIIPITLNKNCYVSWQHVLTLKEVITWWPSSKAKLDKSAPITVDATDSLWIQDHWPLHIKCYIYIAYAVF